MNREREKEITRQIGTTRERKKETKKKREKMRGDEMGG